VKTKKQFNGREFASKVMEECHKELAMNFETPAVRILAYYGNQLGLTADEIGELMRKAVKS
jgi:hypothetical protein